MFACGQRHLISIKRPELRRPHYFSMIAFVYRCPRTGLKVQGHVADDLIEVEAYEAVTCTACGRVHLVNPKSGKVLETAKG
jgi:DNA-directed RNA polymerase subunit RPC12/RpoP